MPDRSIQFRPATGADAASLAALGSTVWIDTYARESVTPGFARHVLAEFTERRMAERIASADAFVWVAEADGGLVGFADMSLSQRSELLPDARQAEIARLYVLERFTRKGIGKTLLQRCAQTAFERGAAVIWLSVWSGNERALAFYRGQGWTRVGGITFTLGAAAYPNDVFALRKHLFRIGHPDFDSRRCSEFPNT